MTAMLFVMLVIILIFCMYYLAPLISKPDVFFGCRMDPVFSDDKWRIIKNYHQNLILSGLLTIAGGLAFFFIFNRNSTWLMYYTFVPITCGTLIYIRTNSLVKKYKSQNATPQVLERITVSLDRVCEGEKVEPISLFWLIPGLLMSLYTFLHMTIGYDRLPPSLPIHIDFDGLMRMVPKSHFTALIIPSIMFLLLLVFVLAYFSIIHAKMPLDSRDPLGSKIKQLKSRRIWTGVVILFATVVILQIFLVNLSAIGMITLSTRSLKYLVWLTLAFELMLPLLTSLVTGQGGSRLKAKPQKTSDFLNRNDDYFWWFGLIYVNKEDPTIFIEKRMGVGWTINFGNKWACLGFMAFLLLIFGLILIVSRLLG